MFTCFYRLFNVCFQGLGQYWTVFQFVAWTVFLQFFCRGLGPWTHLCNKHWFLYVCLQFFLYDRFGSFPASSLHRFVTGFCYRMWALHNFFFFFNRMSGKCLLTKTEETMMKPVFVTLIIYIYICIYMKGYINTYSHEDKL